MSERQQSALLGGLFIGVLSALPYVSSLNACCCLWVIAGGVLTTYLLQANVARPVLASEGAIAGLLAGALGAVIATLLGALLDLLRGQGFTRQLDDLLQSGLSLPPEFVTLIERMREVPVAVWYFASLAAGLVVFPIFGMLGGLLGVAIFKKSAPPPPPPGTVEVLPPL